MTYTNITPNITNIRKNTHSLTVSWADGSETEMVYIWLRDNHISNFHEQAQERLTLTESFNPDIQPIATSFNEKSITITWENEPNTPLTYTAEWIVQYAKTNRKRKIKRTFWKGNEYTPPAIEYNDFCNDPKKLHKWMLEVLEYGLALVKNAPTEESVLLSATQSIGHIRETNYGKDFKVISKPNPDNLAYTSHALALHTDLTFLEPVPHFQFLHCIANDADGGLSTYVDAWRIALDFKAEHPESFKVLTETKVPHRFSDSEGKRYIVRYTPVICLNDTGDIDCISYSNHMSYITDLSPEDTKRYYTAYIKWGKFLNQEKYVHKFRMEAGTIAVFDNRRVMHGRTEFFPNTGFRHLQGTYICESEYYSRLTVLERQLSGQDWKNFIHSK